MLERHLCHESVPSRSHSKSSPYVCFFFFNVTATSEIYTLSLHDALPISCHASLRLRVYFPINRSTLRSSRVKPARGKTRSEEHTSERQSLAYLVCRLLLEKKKINKPDYLLWGIHLLLVLFNMF